MERTIEPGPDAFSEGLVSRSVGILLSSRSNPLLPSDRPTESEIMSFSHPISRSLLPPPLHCRESSHRVRNSISLEGPFAALGSGRQAEALMPINTHWDGGADRPTLSQITAT